MRITRSAWRPVAALVALAVLIPTAAWSGHETSNVGSFTGCLKPGGTIYNVAVGDTPLAACKPNDVHIHLSGGDVTAVDAGVGLSGGGGNGAVALNIPPSFRLPQACGDGSVPTSTATGWACSSDTAGSTLSASGYASLNPSNYETVVELDLSAGSYLLVGKGQALNQQNFSDIVSCNLYGPTGHLDASTATLPDPTILGTSSYAVLAFQATTSLASDGSVHIECIQTHAGGGLDVAITLTAIPVSA